jgi:hypothetical protein
MGHMRQMLYLSIISLSVLFLGHHFPWIYHSYNLSISLFHPYTFIHHLKLPLISTTAALIDYFNLVTLQKLFGFSQLFKHFSCALHHIYE